MSEGINEKGEKIKYLANNYQNFKHLMLANNKLRNLLSTMPINSEKRILNRNKRKKGKKK